MTNNNLDINMKHNEYLNFREIQNLKGSLLKCHSYMGLVSFFFVIIVNAGIVFQIINVLMFNHINWIYFSGNIMI